MQNRSTSDLNFKIILSNVDETLQALNSLKKRLEEQDLSEIEFRISLKHAYHHLNFAWNVRRETTQSYAALTDEDFEKWGKYPAGLEVD